jgi:tRNA G18 (ribose-2'-O)-methylase SpoU
MRVSVIVQITNIYISMCLFLLSVRSDAMVVLPWCSAVAGTAVYRTISTTFPSFTFRSVTPLSSRPSMLSNYRRLLLISRMQLRSTSSDHPRKAVEANTLAKDDLLSTNATGTDDMSYRRSLLHEKLLELDCFADESDVLNFEYVVQQSMIDPTSSIFVTTEINDDADKNNEINRISGIQTYGKSTIKTCQTFYYPKQNTVHGLQHPPTRESQVVTMKIAAARTARQIEFLYQRHKAQQTQWIRNHDSLLQPTTNATTASTESEDSSTCSGKTIRKYYPFVVVLDNLRSAQNVGSIYRTADATKCQQVITIGITPNPCTGNGIHKVQKASLGAELYVPTQHFSNATMALQYIHRTFPSYQIICVETTSESIPYTDVHYKGLPISDGTTNNEEGMVFIFGNEVTGVDVSFYLSQINKLNHLSHSLSDNDEDLSADDDSMAMLQDQQSSQPITTEPTKKVLCMIEIPMYGTKNSLNVAVCVSIILYEMIRQCNIVERVVAETEI